MSLVYRPLSWKGVLTLHRNYLLAQAHVDAPALSNSIAHLNTSSTFSPLQPLQDTDVGGYLRIAHEQTLISTIEEARRQTQEEFYAVLEDRSQKDWEAKKKRVFEELGTRIGGPVGDRTIPELRASHSKGSFVVSPFLDSDGTLDTYHPSSLHLLPAYPFKCKGR